MFVWIVMLNDWGSELVFGKMRGKKGGRRRGEEGFFSKKMRGGNEGRKESQNNSKRVHDIYPDGWMDAGIDGGGGGGGGMGEREEECMYV